MFVDFRDQPPPPRWEPRRPPPRLTPRDERVLGWIIGFNLVMLLLAPLAGVTLFDAVAALFRG